MNKEPQAQVGQYLTFTLNQQIFGIPIEFVREINQLPEITPIPNTPACVAGVINLRDKVVPVIDLRRKFNIAEISHTRETCVIVVDSRQGQVAIIVDTVASVVPFANDQIELPPALLQEPESNFILGLGKVGKQVLVLLDIMQVLDRDNIHKITDLSRLSLEHQAA